MGSSVAAFRICQGFCLKVLVSFVCFHPDRKKKTERATNPNQKIKKKTKKADPFLGPFSGPVEDTAWSISLHFPQWPPFWAGTENGAVFFRIFLIFARTFLKKFAPKMGLRQWYFSSEALI